MTPRKRRDTPPPHTVPTEKEVLQGFLGWALTQRIEETGRYAGPADVLRELIDGATGR